MPPFLFAAETCAAFPFLFAHLALIAAAIFDRALGDIRRRPLRAGGLDGE